MKKQHKNKKKWSKKFFQSLIGVWNCWSLSNERYHYCDSLQYDILGLTELHNNQAKELYQGRRWVCSAHAETNEQDKISDPEAGVAIMLSPRMADKVIGQGHVGTRIAWVRISGPVCNIFYVVVYSPHKGRTQKLVAQDTITQLKKLLRTVRKSDCIIVGGDFNCQLQRNVEGCTGQWSMTKRANENGHGNKVLNLMREFDLFAVDTLFKPKRKLWNDKYRECNATYLPKDGSRRPTKLDYLCVSNRFKSMIIGSEVRWGPSIHRFGQKFDHGLVSAKWRWKTKKKKKQKRPDFAAMGSQSWPSFDEDLRIRLQKQEEPRAEVEKHVVEQKEHEDTVTAEDLGAEYSKLAKCVYETIKNIVPEKKWIQKNGRVVSKETKKLFEDRAKEFKKQAPTKVRRKRWNRRIRNACRNDYRSWVTTWVQKIEHADEKGNTKEIFKGVKALSGSTTHSSTAPTEHFEAEAQPTEIDCPGKCDRTDQANRSQPTEIDCPGKCDRTDQANRSQPTKIAKTANDEATNDTAYGGAASDGAASGEAANGAVRRASTRINGPAELASVWHEFLKKKFSATEAEKIRAEFEALPEDEEENAELTRKEFDEAVKCMKNGKATGADGIPSEVWKHSAVARDALYAFLRKVWSKEEVPKNLAVCIFIMLYKKKGSHNDCSKYRAIGLLNHAYKIMSVVLLRRLVEECKGFFSEWQAGFRAKRGCRDNLLLLRVLYDQVIARNKKCVITYIDYSAAFDSVSHKFMDQTLANAGAKRKSRAIFRAIYQAATGIARVRGTEGQTVFSQAFEIRRGVIQGDIISPVLFILALDQIMKTVDGKSEGVKCGRILRIKTLGYADDIALAEEVVQKMTTRLTTIADASEAMADMSVNMKKTFSQHVFRRKAIKATSAEAKNIESKYENKCDFCERRFKTKRGMRIHRAKCQHNYGTTEEVYTVDEIVAVFGHKNARWFKVRYHGYPEPEWNREHLLVRDGCTDTIKDFWAKSGLQSAKEYYPDPDGLHRCTVCSKTFARRQDLKAHRTRTGHSEQKDTVVTATAMADAIIGKRKEMQNKMSKTKWGEKEADNCWLFKYLDSIYEAGGGEMTDVKRRIAMARQRFGRMRHIWNDKTLHQNLRIRLYKASVCSVLTYGSEAWCINEAVAKKINGANASMMSVITGKTQHQEATTKWQTFDLVKWIRARRL